MTYNPLQLLFNFHSSAIKRKKKHSSSCHLPFLTNWRFGIDETPFLLLRFLCIDKTTIIKKYFTGAFVFMFNFYFSHKENEFHKVFDVSKIMVLSLMWFFLLDKKDLTGNKNILCFYINVK